MSFVDDTSRHQTGERIEMRRSKIPNPTAAELTILGILWLRGAATVREVHDSFSLTRKVGYTTVLKILQIMMEKGLVLRDEKRRSHVYRSAVNEEHTQRQLVGDLLDRAFGGSSRKLVLSALSTKKASPDELKEIRRLLDEMEQPS
jgi:BlaI family transcriptional regulator, penicillinase repressor